jgi:heme-degrading monooxygenase HmoA
MPNVVLINPFEVPENVGDDQFMGGWQRAADYLRSQPGFVGTRLHRAISPNARFRFVNVAEWESPQAFQAAVTSETFRNMAGGTPPNYPSLYEVVTMIEGGDTAPGGSADGETQ